MMCPACHPIAGALASFCISCYRMSSVFNHSYTPRAFGSHSLTLLIPLASFLADLTPLITNLQQPVHLQAVSATFANRVASQILSSRNRRFTMKPYSKPGSSSASQYSNLIFGMLYHMVCELLLATVGGMMPFRGSS